MMEQNHATQPLSNLPVRVKNELAFRRIIVKQVETVAGCFKRIVLQGEQLQGFSSRGFDDHTKLFFPVTAGDEVTPPTVSDDGIVWPDGPRPQSRDYTPLSFDAQTQELTLDFYLHDGGVASQWAENAQPGDPLVIGGPRGSLIVPTTYAWQLYVCDETGLPAVKRRLADLHQSGVNPHITLVVRAQSAQCVDYLNLGPEINVEWIITTGQSAAEADTAVMNKLKSLTLPDADYFVWLTGEGQFVKTMNDHFTLTRGLDPAFVRSVAYWHHKS
jgi:ferric-chelate reductase (NADPH)|nr:siderophore-interacting protein [Ewingella americana]